MTDFTLQAKPDGSYWVEIHDCYLRITDGKGTTAALLSVLEYLAKRALMATGWEEGEPIPDQIRIQGDCNFPRLDKLLHGLLAKTACRDKLQLFADKGYIDIEFSENHKHRFIVYNHKAIAAALCAINYSDPPKSGPSKICTLQKVDPPKSGVSTLQNLEGTAQKMEGTLQKVDPRISLGNSLGNSSEETREKPFSPTDFANDQMESVAAAPDAEPPTETLATPTPNPIPLVAQRSGSAKTRVPGGGANDAHWEIPPVGTGELELSAWRYPWGIGFSAPDPDFLEFLARGHLTRTAKKGDPPATVHTAKRWLRKARKDRVRLEDAFDHWEEYQDWLHGVTPQNDSEQAFQDIMAATFGDGVPSDFEQAQRAIREAIA